MLGRTLQDGRYVISAGKHTPIILPFTPTAQKVESIVQELPDGKQILGSRDITPLSCRQYVVLTLSLLIIIPALMYVLVWIYQSIEFLQTHIASEAQWITHICTVVYFISASVVPAVGHELCHMIYGNTFRSSRLHFGSKATTNLNHIWAWPRSASIFAVGIGPVCDVMFLIAGSCWFLLDSSPGAIVLVFVSLARILWELNLFQVRDGRLLANLLADKPEGFFSVSSSHAKYSVAIDALALVLGVLGLLAGFSNRWWLF